MKGDFSRFRFNPRKQYTAVLEQQGRVALDADANEQRVIDDYLGTTETIDVIGPYGGPAGAAGFSITVSGNEILIGAGRYYVAGLLCENKENNLSYGSQTFLLDPSPADSTLLAELQQAGANSAIQVFLQVWQRMVTALDDPCLRDPALGQADTTVRLQTVWRVVANLVSTPHVNPVGSPLVNSIQGLPALDCCEQMYIPTSHDSTGTLAATTGSATGDCSCQPIPAAGYQGLENQLYRVEIHHGGDATTATFKWSRENGSVVAAIVGISGPTVLVNSLGPDANLGFKPNDWVEISDDAYLFGQTPNQPGMLYQILSVDPAGPTITLKTPAIGVNPAQNARIRRWDQSGPSAGPNGIPLQTNGSLSLENGIQVTFGEGSYQSGDYWNIAARVASGTIDWPPCGGDGNQYQPPISFPVINAPLACIHWDPVHNQPVVEPCQRTFSPLTSVAPGAPSALHITSYSWRNDDVITFDSLLNSGLTLTLDTAPSGPISGANFIVTIETANPSISPNAAPDALLFQTIPLNPYILDWQITVNASTRQISWELPGTSQSGPQGTYLLAINSLLGGLAAAGVYARARVKLLGHTIFAQSGTTLSFLDGQSFGQQAVRQDGRTPCVSLQMPSGNGAKASDFEGWFYLAPMNQLLALAMNYEELTVLLTNNVVTGVTPTGSPSANITPQVTVSLLYPAVARGATVSLSVKAVTTGVNATNYVSLADNLTIPQGSSAAPININVFGNPGIGANSVANAYLFEITAQYQLANGSVTSASTQFTLTGAQPVVVTR